jgi:hypothetical protein
MILETFVLLSIFIYLGILVILSKSKVPCIINFQLNNVIIIVLNSLVILLLLGEYFYISGKYDVNPLNFFEISKNIAEYHQKGNSFGLLIFMILVQLWNWTRNFHFVSIRQLPDYHSIWWDGISINNIYANFVMSSYFFFGFMNSYITIVTTIANVMFGDRKNSEFNDASYISKIVFLVLLFIMNVQSYLGSPVGEFYRFCGIWCVCSPVVTLYAMFEQYVKKKHQTQDNKYSGLRKRKCVTVDDDPALDDPVIEKRNIFGGIV